MERSELFSHTPDQIKSLVETGSLSGNGTEGSGGPFRDGDGDGSEDPENDARCEGEHDGCGHDHDHSCTQH